MRHSSSQLHLSATLDASSQRRGGFSNVEQGLTSAGRSRVSLSTRRLVGFTIESEVSISFFFFFSPTRQSPRCLASVIRQYRRAPCSTLRVIVFSGEKIKVDVKIARHFVIFTADDHGILRRSAALVYEHTRAYASEGKRAQVDNTEDFRRYTAILASSP